MSSSFARLVCVAAALLFSVGCAAISLNPNAQSVEIVTNNPEGCDFVGQVEGDQGNFFTGAFTSNADLEVGARNSMLNQAADLGANKVLLLASRAAQTASISDGDGQSQQTNVVYIGQAYRCEK